MAKFKVGDEVAIAALVKITAIQPNNNDTVSYSTDRGISIHETLLDQIAIKPKEPKAEEPAPEPPKFYTGKVVMVGCKLDDRKHLINTLFEFRDGYYVGREQRGIVFCFGPYKSFDQIVKDHSVSTWIEVKVPSDV